MTQDASNRAARSGCDAKTAKWPKILLGVVLIVLCGVIRYHWNASPASADPSGRSDSEVRFSDRTARTSDEAAEARQSEPTRRSPHAKNRSDDSIPLVVATVNTRRITREDLARDCLRHFGKEVLESMVNKRLIMLECQRRGVKVTRRDVNDEVEEMAARFKIPVDQWLKMLKQERNVSPEQYADDIIWPTIALRKLAGAQLSVSQQEVRHEFETQYGEQIKVLLISSGSREKAEQLRAQAAADPNNFGNLAKNESEDSASAALKGVINPIRRHGSTQEIEDAVFNMRDGEISPVIQAAGQYLIFKRVEAIPPRDVAFDRKTVDRLRAFIRDRKMRAIAQDVFRSLQDEAKKQQAIQVVWNDPVQRQRMPGVAATVYDDQITIRELAEQCIARHGREVLEGTINRTLIDLECKKQQITVSEEDVEREIERMAAEGVKAKPDGSPDVKAWLALMAKKGVSPEVYRRDAVWPTVAMKKLVAGKIKITDEDLQKGYEANFGERVRCLAIVLNDQRRAEQIFEMARKHDTPEYFGRLAAQYSIEPGSQALQGEVPPIRKHGGQPEMEREAFKLHDGELSGIISVEDKFVILRCLGRTKPVVKNFADVRDEIYRDLHEKKLQVAMTERFEAMQEAATIDNYLANTSHSPPPTPRSASSANQPAFRQISGR
jgi:parvulin-like peptidyl-prolyl isomerase